MQFSHIQILIYTVNIYIYLFMCSWYGMVLRLCKCLASGTWLRLRPFFSVPGFRHCKIWLRAKVGTTHTHPSSVTPCHSTIQSFICQSHFQLSIHPFIHPSNCLFVHPPIHPSMFPVVHPFISPCVYIYIYLFIYIYLYLFIYIYW